MPWSVSRLRHSLHALRPGPKREFSGSAAPCPPRPAYIIGDIHGCSDLMARLLDAIEADTQAQGWSEADRVFVGDYIDRGPDSAGVLREVRRLQAAAPAQVHCLRGNHEAMLLDFLADPVKAGPTWLHNGGRDTLHSFGVTLPLRLADPDTLTQVGNAARAAIPPQLVTWITQLPLIWQGGNLVAVHAGLHPDRAPDDQSNDHLLWGPPGFPQRPRQDGLWVAYGHRITVPPVARAGRISVDTGGYAHGVLSCAVLAPETAPRYLQVGP